MEGYVADVQDRDDPGVIIGCDTPFFAHAGGVRISDISAINVRDEI